MFSTFSVHYPSITEYRFGRPATDGNHLYETRVILLIERERKLEEDGVRDTETVVPALDDRGYASLKVFDLPN